jgi:hypothetical protein
MPPGVRFEDAVFGDACPRCSRERRDPLCSGLPEVEELAIWKSCATSSHRNSQAGSRRYGEYRPHWPKVRMPLLAVSARYLDARAPASVQS